MAVTEKKEPYGFEVGFEHALIALSCQRPTFWGRAGHALDPDCVALPASKLALQTVRAIAKELGKGPTSVMLVIQRLRRWQGEGKVTGDQIKDVAAVLDDAEEAGLPDEEAVIAEVIPVLKRRMERRALDSAFQTFQHRGDLGVVVDQFQKAQRLGEVDASIGTILGEGSFAEMSRLRKIQRLPTGILELDDALAGGAYRGTLSVFMGGSGGGKSMGLIQVAVNAAMHGLDVGLATLELPEPIILARLKANMTAIAIDRILEEADDPESEVRKKIAELQARGTMGRIVVKHFSPQATTVEDLKAWRRTCKERHDIDFAVVVADYADKMTAKSRDDSGYNIGKLVYEGFRLWAEQDDFWAWTACAAKRDDKSKGGKRKLDGDDAADSIHKLRVSDLWITLNQKEEDEMILYFIAKNRLGKARISVGPLPHDFVCARIAPVTYETCDDLPGRVVF